MALDVEAQLRHDHPDWFIINNKYAPKLDFARRCAVYGFWKMGISIPVLAEAYSINRSTVRYIVNQSSRYYKDVRKTWDDMEPSTFHLKFCGPDEQAKIAKAAKSPNVVATEATIDDRKAAITTGVPSRRAIGKAGPVTIHFPDFDGSTLTFDVAFVDEVVRPEQMVEDEEPRPGWYLVLKADQPGFSAGCYGADKDRLTSTSALKAFITEHNGEIV